MKIASKKKLDQKPITISVTEAPEATVLMATRTTSKAGAYTLKLRPGDTLDIRDAVKVNVVIYVQHTSEIPT